MRYVVLVLFAMIFLAALAITNFITATSTCWTTDPFMNYVFITAPVAIVCQLSLLNPKKTSMTKIICVIVAATILCSFAYASMAWFSPNPYESFSFINVYFGPHGWTHWLWLVAAGVLPFLYLLPRIANYYSIRVVLLAFTVCAYLHNIVHVVALCHTPTL